MREGVVAEVGQHGRAREIKAVAVAFSQRGIGDAQGDAVFVSACPHCCLVGNAAGIPCVLDGDIIKFVVRIHGVIEYDPVPIAFGFGFRGEHDGVVFGADRGERGVVARDGNTHGRGHDHGVGGFEGPMGFDAQSQGADEVVGNTEGFPCGILRQGLARDGDFVLVIAGVSRSGVEKSHDFGVGQDRAEFVFREGVARKSGQMGAGADAQPIPFTVANRRIRHLQGDPAAIGKCLDSASGRVGRGIAGVFDRHVSEFAWVIVVFEVEPDP